MALSENYRTETICRSDCRPIVRLSADTIVRWDYRPNPSWDICADDWCTSVDWRVARLSVLIEFDADLRVVTGSSTLVCLCVCVCVCLSVSQFVTSHVVLPSQLCTNILHAVVISVRFKWLLEIFLFGRWDRSTLWLTVKAAPHEFSYWLTPAAAAACRPASSSSDIGWL